MPNENYSLMVKLNKRVMSLLSRLYPIILEKITNKRYTGKIVIVINCKDGNIGNTEAHVQRDSN